MRNNWVNRCRRCAGLLFLFLVLLGQVTTLQAQSRAIPTPLEILKFNPGDDFKIADWKQITNYFAVLDEKSDRVKVEAIGSSTLKQPLIVAYISAAENIRNLEKHKKIQGKLADPRLVKTESERDELIRDGKTVVVISCSIHSTEIVASQMSMQLAYNLATAKDAETLEILRNTILLLIPSPNPDGINIVADWYRKTLGTPYEGSAPPELYHHYAGHDDNRDWFMLNLKETRAITRLLWKEWFPEIVYDVHQQGTTGSRMFIPPFFDPPNPRIPPLLLRQVGLLGHKMAADLEAAGVHGVITNALYDTWWHGGFRTAPYFHNSIGILSEAASARLMSPVTITTEQLKNSTTRGMNSALETTTNFPNPWPGGVWHPHDILKIELITSRAILSMASKYRAEYLKNFYELGARAVKEDAGGEQESILGFLIPAGQGNDEISARLITALLGQGIEVHRMEKELYLTTRTDAGVHTGEVPAGSFLVFLAQPQRANIESLFEAQHYPTRLTAKGEAERPYDVAGWTLPMQMGVEYAVVTKIKEAAGERSLKLLSDENQVRQDFGLKLRLGDQSPILNPIKVGVRVGLYKSWTGSMDEGWTRFVFDTFNLPYNSVFDRDIRSGNLGEKYDVIILPSLRTREIIEGNRSDVYPPEYSGGISREGTEQLRKFVEGGGKLICFDRSCDFAIATFKLPLKNSVSDLKSSEFYCPGSILRLVPQGTHPITQNVSGGFDAYFANSSAFEENKLIAVSDNSAGGTSSKNSAVSSVRVIARYAHDNLLRSGWLLGEKNLAGKAALVECQVGSGHVILFGFPPQNRGQTWGTFQLIFNAIN